jgi:predicted MFS family arabinose efflux permease
LEADHRMPAAAPSTPAAPLWRFIGAGFAAQLAAAYFDNARGPLLPPMAKDLGLEFTQTGTFLAVGQVAATTATLALIKALNRYAERTVVAVIAGIAVLAGFLAPLASSYPALLGFAAALGASISAMGTMANVLIVEGTPPKRLSRMLAGLHSMYGFGSMGAAAIVGWALAAGVHWAYLYTGATPGFALLGLFAVLALPSRHARGGGTVQPARLSAPQALVVLTFAIYVAGEVTTTVWLTTFLVSVHGLAVSDATPYLSALFLVMAGARVACALLVRERWERAILQLALFLPMLGFLVGYFCDFKPAFALAGLFGPFFPVFLARQSRRFPDRWRSITIWTMVSMSVTIGAGNFLVGRLADLLGLKTAYLLPPVLFAAAALLLNLVLASERRSAPVAPSAVPG